MLSWLLIDATASFAQTSGGTKTLDNWAGYVISDAAYLSVSASWVVPEVDCSLVAAGQTTQAIAWVGLGGYRDTTIAQTTLEQVGTIQGCNGSIPTYGLFYEFFPAAPQSGQLVYTLSAGDTVSARVTQNFDGTYTLWEQATAKGATSPKWTFTTTGSSPGTRSSDPGNRSAEVIVEQGGYSGTSTRLPMASYGSITFFNVAYAKATTATDEATTIQFYEPLDGNIMSTQRAIPAVLSPTSFIVYQL